MIDAAVRRNAHVRRETMVSGVINAVISVVLSLIVFGFDPVPAQAVAISFFPQTVGITVVGGLVPSLITLALVARGRIVPAAPVPSRWGQTLRILGCAALAVPLLGGSAALLLIALGPAVLPPWSMLAVNAAYGIAVGLLTTPPIVRMALGMEPWRRGRPAPPHEPPTVL